MYYKGPINKYIADLSSKLPAPGGGSASALVSTAGVGLLLMVANFTVDKKGYENYQNEIRSLLLILEKYTAQLEKLVDEDITAYGKISAVYKLPKDTDEQKAYKEQQNQSVLKEAMEVPLQIMTASNEVLTQTAERLLEIGNKNLITDVACGVLFLKAGIDGAKYNVDINLSFIKDSGFVSKKRDITNSIISNSRTITEKILGKIQV